jgi:arsenite methyltransferase
VLVKKVLNVGFEAIAIEERRPVGIDELAHYPVFPEELAEFLRRAIPESRHDELVWAVTLTALKPSTPEGDTDAA